MADRPGGRPRPRRVDGGSRVAARAQDQGVVPRWLQGHVAVEPESGIITANTVTPGNTGDADAAAELLADEQAPVEVLADAAYGSGQTRKTLDDAGHTAVIKPPPLRPAVPGGFDRDDFTVDHDARTVTCPNGETVAITAKGTATFGARCRTCPLRGGAPPAGRGAA